MRQKGYPRNCKNIAISNGGKELLYPDNTPTLALDYFVGDGAVNVKSYRQVNNTNNYETIFSGNFTDGFDNDYSVHIIGGIAYDNAPVQRRL